MFSDDAINIDSVAVYSQKFRDSCVFRSFLSARLMLLLVSLPLRMQCSDDAMEFVDAL